MKKIILSVLLCTVMVGCSTEAKHVIAKSKLTHCNEAAVEILADGMIKGTGAFISSDGLIITASHLFEGDTHKVEVLSHKYGRLQATLLRRDRRADIALVKVAKNNQPFTHLKLADKMPIQGETTCCLGAALWNPIMMLSGAIANPGRNWCEYPTSNGYGKFAFVSVAIPGLSSGGPWINHKGELFGVQTGHLLSGGKDAGVAMVGRLPAIKRLLDAKHSIHSSSIGAWVWPLWTSDKNLIDGFPVGTEGLIINAYRVNNSPLKVAGAKQYEVIISCNGVKTVRRADLMEVVDALKPGTVATVEILNKNGKTRKLKIKLTDNEPGVL